MTTPDTENSDPLLTQTNRAETRKKNFQVAGLLFLACVFVGFTKSGWVAVMFGLSVAPLETLATQLGVVIVPFVGGWVIARGLKFALKEVAFNTMWIWCVVILSVAILFSAPQETATSAAKNRDASVPKSITGVTNAKTFSFESAVCSDKIAKEQWSEAVPVCTTAANQGDTAAQFYLGLMYSSGLGVAEDRQQALRWYTLAAEQGDNGAQFSLGLMYRDGEGVAQNYAQVVRLWTLAAEQGNTLAQFSLGLLYRDGQKVVRDYAKAVRWYTLAAEQGNVDAQNNLGLMYGLGQGVAQDYARAHMWLNLAAVSGNENSVKGRDLVASKMTREQIAKAQQMATDCKAKNYKKC